MKAVKIIGVVLGLLVALLIVAGIAVVSLFDPNDYKGYVSDWAETSTGRRLEIADDLELSFFPWLAVETGGITVGNAPGFEDSAFATIERVSARVRLLPLVSRRVEIGTVRIDGLALDLATAADGRTNWDDLLAAGAGADDAAEDAAAGEAGAVGDLNIEAITLRGARIVWRENTTETRYVVSELDLETGAIETDQPIDVDVAMNVLDAASGQSAAIEGSATVSLQAGGGVSSSDIEIELAWHDADARELGTGRVTLAELAVPQAGPLLARGGALAARLVEASIGRSGPAELDLTASWREASVDVANLAVSVVELTTTIGGIRAAWQLTGESADGGQTATIRGSVDIDDGPVGELLALLGIAAPGELTADELGSLDASASFTFDTGTQRFDANDVRVTALGINLRADPVTSGGSGTSARITIAPFAPNAAVRRLIAAHVPEAIDVGALGRIALDATVALGEEQTTLSRVNAELFGATLSGEIGFAGDGTIGGTLATNRFAPDELLAAMRAYLPETIDPATAGTFAVSTRFRYDPRAASASLGTLQLEAFGLNASGELTASDLDGHATYTGRASLAPFDPRDFLHRFGMPVPQTSDDGALRRASVEATLRITPDAGAFENLTVALDDSRITGSLTVRDFSDPSYEFRLNADTLDVDRYLPPTAEEAAPDERTAGDLELSNEQLTALRIDGAVRVGALRLAGLDFQSVATEIRVGAGRLQLDSAQANLYGGTFNGRLDADATAETPSLLLEGRTAGVQLEPLLRALTGDASFSGTADFDIDLRGHGATMTENLRSAGGTMGFALANGAIAGFNIDELLCTQYNRISENPPPREDAPDRTPYRAIQGTAIVADGIARSSDLFAQAGSFEVRGTGSLDLADAMTDYKFEARLAQTVPIPGCDTMDHMIGVDFPLVMTGPITAPDPRPDYSEVVKRVIEDQIRDRIEDRLEDRIRDLFR